MRLTLGSFFSNLIIHPLEADTKKERIVALVASLALLSFAGVFHIACWVYCRCTHKSTSEQMTATDNKTNDVKDKSLGNPTSTTAADLTEPPVATTPEIPVPSSSSSSLSPTITTPTNPQQDDSSLQTPSISTGAAPQKTNKVDSFYEQTMSPELQNNINILLEGYYKNHSELDNNFSKLPVYGNPINLNLLDEVKAEDMTHPVMMGITNFRQPVIVIKLEYDLSDEDIKSFYGADLPVRNYKNFRTIKTVLLLGGVTEGSSKWVQLTPMGARDPSFFYNYFTNDEGSISENNQEVGFKLLQNLLANGQGVDCLRAPGISLSHSQITPQLWKLSTK